MNQKQNSDPENSNVLKPEDYVEPNCVLCGDPYGVTPEVKPVPQQRIIQKMDEYMSRKDYEGAERHLLYWLEEAKLGKDLRGQLSIRNELIGFYRKRGRKEPAYENIEAALDLLKELGFEGTISSGTTYTNSATAYYSFGEYEPSLLLFEKAKEVYEANERTDPSLLGGLYNNMALTYVGMRQFSDAASLYQKALVLMDTVPGGILEQAITYLNLANLKEAELGMEAAEKEIFDLLDKAEEKLEEAARQLDTDEALNEGYYAFVLESCAPTFSYYGYFMTADTLNRRAKEIYERT
ncbi:MAG: tetratricopeptide repeat protein [Parasporobacterium sp.]|nr:tetratricopeptide repeat protein [Parasporobacterium sp.]